jgi:hypothetical protein
MRNKGDSMANTKINILIQRYVDKGFIYLGIKHGRHVLVGQDHYVIKIPLNNRDYTVHIKGANFSRH